MTKMLYSTYIVKISWIGKMIFKAAYYYKKDFQARHLKITAKHNLNQLDITKQYHPRFHIIDITFRYWIPL